MATQCEHTDRKLYARKVCKGCYLRIFFRGKKKALKEANKEDSDEQEGSEK